MLALDLNIGRNSRSPAPPENFLRLQIRRTRALLGSSFKVLNLIGISSTPVKSAGGVFGGSEYKPGLVARHVVSGRCWKRGGVRAWFRTRWCTYSQCPRRTAPLCTGICCGGCSFFVLVLFHRDALQPVFFTKGNRCFCSGELVFRGVNARTSSFISVCASVSFGGCVVLESPPQAAGERFGVFIRLVSGEKVRTCIRVCS